MPSVPIVHLHGASLRNFWCAQIAAVQTPLIGTIVLCGGHNHARGAG
jgi:hypothetical protein